VSGRSIEGAFTYECGERIRDGPDVLRADAAAVEEELLTCRLKTEVEHDRSVGIENGLLGSEDGELRMGHLIVVSVDRQRQRRGEGAGHDESLGGRHDLSLRPFAHISSIRQTPSTPSRK
jgi:hypothetical protein